MKYFVQFAYSHFFIAVIKENSDLFAFLELKLLHFDVK